MLISRQSGEGGEYEGIYARARPAERNGGLDDVAPGPISRNETLLNGVAILPSTAFKIYGQTLLYRFTGAARLGPADAHKKQETKRRQQKHFA